ncbi:MAG: PilZ domain-containing protein [Treponema sp.]|jgi:c-di-GMP-binding flagellar brake protein YcgR|nr:PilZ domain-containing protein [Treponema sp.]
MTHYVFLLYPLQNAVSDFWRERSSSTENAMYFGIILTISITVIIILNLFIKKGSGNKPESRSGRKLFSGFAFHRLARSIGLNREQIKMLDFVFQIDDVTDPEKSISTPTLLDHSFRHAYRVIEQTSSAAELQHKLSVLFSTRNILENSTIGALSSTNEIKEETKLIINSGRDKFNANVIINEPEFFGIETPKNVLGSHMKITKGTRLNVLFFTRNNKGFSFETRVLGYSNIHGHHTLKLAHSNQLIYLSQRRFRRRQTVIACFMNLIYFEGSKKKQRLVVDKRRLSGNIVDISVGGCSIKTTAPVQVGVRFKIEFEQGDNTLAALGQVLRTNRTSIATIIHIKFLRVTQKSMNLINAFVYDYMQ